MRITPLDIYQREFKKILRGFDPDEVEEFLEQVADDYEQLIKENVDLKERIEYFESQMASGDKSSQTYDTKRINDLIQQAEKRASEIIQNAKAEADKIIRSAQKDVEEIARGAETQSLQAKDKDAEDYDVEVYQKADSVLEEVRAKASQIIEKAKADELELRREISRLKSQKEQFLLAYRELLEKHLKLLTQQDSEK